jgi:hypothetical protein
MTQRRNGKPSGAISTGRWNEQTIGLRARHYEDGSFEVTASKLKELEMASYFQYLPRIQILERPNSSVAYRKEVQRYLHLLRTTHAGRTLIKFIGAGTEELFIVPTRAMPGAPLYAAAVPMADEDAIAKNHPITESITIPELDLVMNVPTNKLGTGRGTPVFLQYHPAMWRQVSANAGRIEVGRGPGEVLFHEMIHALRALYGLMFMRNISENIRISDLEEFYAIMAANVYRSERGFTSLRRDYREPAKLERNLATSESYYHHYKNPINEWFGAQRAFCAEMAGSPAKFNPFREAAIALGYMKRPSFPMRLP